MKKLMLKPFYLLLKNDMIKRLKENYCGQQFIDSVMQSFDMPTNLMGEYYNITNKHKKSTNMYKAIQNNNFYLAINKFPKSAKNVSNVYKTGFRKFDGGDTINYSIVIRTFRIILGIKKQDVGECCA